MPYSRSGYLFRRIGEQIPDLAADICADLLKSIKSYISVILQAFKSIRRDQGTGCEMRRLNVLLIEQGKQFFVIHHH